MKPSRARLRIEALEERITPAPVNIGFGSGVHKFTVAGYNLFQNNKNTATTSSAFGFSEASMNASQQVDTVGGGNVMAKLTDAFDGVLSFGLAPGGVVSSTTYFDADGVVDITGNTITGDPNTHGTNGNTFNGLALSQQNAIFALHPGVPVIRSLLTITNPTAAPITQQLGDFNNLGSDSTTTIFTTSSGDATFSAAADRWVVTFQQFVGTTSTDPRILQVMQGPGTVQSPFSTNWTGNRSDKTSWLYTVTVGPGQTKYILEFVGLYPTRAAAAADGAIFNSNATVASNGLLAGLTPQELANVVNWDFSPSTAVPPAQAALQEAARVVHLLQPGGTRLAAFAFGDFNSDFTSDIVVAFRLRSGKLLIGTFDGIDGHIRGTFQPFRNAVGANARVQLVPINLKADPVLEIGLIVTPGSLGVPHISAFTVTGIRLF
jgi:hypothetical protein